MLRTALLLTLVTTKGLGAPGSSNSVDVDKPADRNDPPLSKAELPIPAQEVQAARQRLPLDLNQWREKLKPRRVRPENGGKAEDHLGLLYHHGYATQLADKVPHKYVPFKRMVADFKQDAFVTDDDMMVVRNWRISQPSNTPRGGPRGALDLRLGTHSHVTVEGLKSLDLHPTQLACLRLTDVATLSDEDLVNLGALPWLQVLSIQACPNIEGSFLEDFQPLSHLRILELINTPVTDEMLGALSRCKNLRSLHLEGTQVSPEGVEALKTKLSEAGLKTVVRYSPIRKTLRRFPRVDP